MKKQFLILILVLVTLMVVSRCARKNQTVDTIKLNSVKTEDDSKAAKENEIATTTWEIYIDKSLGVSLKYPKEECTIYGSKDLSNFSVECGNAFLEVSRTNWNLEKRSLKEISENNCKINLGHDCKEALKNVDLNGVESYSYTISDRYYYQSSDIKGDEAGRILNGNTEIYILEFKNQIYVVKISDDNLSRLILKNLYFLTNKN